MKEVFELYSKYYCQTCTDISILISSLDENILSKPQNTYYGSIKGLLQHIISGSWHYLDAINKLTDGKCCANLPDLGIIKSSFKTPLVNYLKYLNELADKLWEAIVTISEEDLRKNKKHFKIYNGRL